MQKKILSLLVTSVILFCLAGCSGRKSHKASGHSGDAMPYASKSIDGEYEDWAQYDAPVVNDPIEGFNRAMYKVNDFLYTNLLRPITQLYKDVVPKPIRTSLKNAFRNAHAPIRIVNSGLQGKWKRASLQTQAFLTNTIGGVGGLLNASKNNPKLANIPSEDLGQTFGSWGVGDGFYVFLPFFGPTTLRDGAGSVGDSFMYPFSYINQLEVTIPLNATEAINKGSFRLGDYESMQSSSLDPYSAIKDAYIQHRQRMVKE